jgi:NAD(P)-dependent dehydrogenase (short-subunit alcohol dehydrogenase family)
MWMDLRSKIAIVTGAGTGLGAALTRCLVSEGAIVVAVGRREYKLREVAESTIDPSRVRVSPCDLMDAAAVEQLVATCAREFERLDLVVNNGAVGFGGDFVALTPDEIQRSVSTNLLAPVLLSRAALPHLERTHGVLVNVSSLSGLVPLPGQTVYAATKFALRGFTEALQAELRGRSVRVLAVYPGAIDSEMNSAALRARMADKGFNLPAVMSSDEAGRRLLSAIEDDGCETVVIGNPGERALAWFARRRSPLVRAFSRAMGGAVLELMRESNAMVRAALSA